VYRDFEACWRASKSRDARFDGRFFIGVRTTGIYCRPICPAPSPRRENVRFYPTAAAAQAADLRPCRRCRPESAPRTPEWIGGSALVTRALRLIADGFLDGRPVGELAGALHVSERQLRRLFGTALGAGPLAVARVRRAQAARMLIDQTDLTMAEVAHAAGYSSLRTFNADVRSTFGKPPTELRRRRGHEPSGDALVLGLSYRPPLAWAELLAYLAARATPGVEAVEGSTYRRTASLGGSTCVVEVEDEPARTRLLVRLGGAGVEGIAPAVERARRLADLEADPLQIEGVLCCDHDLAPLVVRRPGLRVPGSWDGFELAVRAVLGQQVTVRGASTLAGRLAAAFGEPLATPSGTLTHCFPTPEALADADVGTIGLPRARARTINRLAAAVRDGRLALEPAADPDATVARLEDVAGIGPWTAQYVALRALRDPDAFPAGDLGLRRAGATAARAERWRPWRAYAAMHLWLTEPHGLRAAA
jgi:AraC family transcriptional regulator, regulatory protein of adaptative response / DNA-3-methyladenine glycosylase II